MTTEARELLAALERAIRGDRRYFVAAKADLAFGPVKPEVEQLLARLHDNAKAEAQRELAAAQSATGEMQAWHAEETASQDYKATLTAMTGAKASFQTESYFGNLDAVTLAKEARTKAQAAAATQKASMQKAIGERFNKAVALRNSITSLLQDPDMPLATHTRSSELQRAMQQYRKAEQRSRVEHYASYKEAFAFLNECLASLQALDTELTSARNHARSERSYRLLLEEAQDAKNYELTRIHLALAFLILSLGCCAYAGAYFFSRVVTNDEGILSVFFLIAVALVALVIADRLWSIHENKPGTEFQWGYFWLLLSFILVGPVVLIITIIVYARGMTSIQEEYRGTIEIAEGQRRAAPLPPERLP